MGKALARDLAMQSEEITTLMRVNIYMVQRDERRVEEISLWVP